MEKRLYVWKQRVKGYADIYILLGFDVMEKLDILLFSDLINFVNKNNSRKSRIDIWRLKNTLKTPKIMRKFLEIF